MPSDLSAAAGASLEGLLGEASSPATSPDRLRELGPVPGLQLALARNPAAPPDLLEGWCEPWKTLSTAPRLGPGQSWRVIHAAMAANPNASWSTLVRLAQHYPREVYDNAAFGFFLLCGESLDHLPGYSLVPLLALPDAPDLWRRAGASHPSHLVRSFVACDPRTPPDALVALLDRAHLCDLVIRNPSLPQATIDRLAQDPDPLRRVLAARCPRTSRARLERLACDEEFRVRAAVARHPQLAERTLWRLGSDEHREVRLVVASNRAAPVGLLQRLWREDDESLQWAVEQNPRLLEVALRAVDPARKKRADGREPAECTRQARLRRVARPSWVRRAAGAAQASGETLELLARSKETAIRRDVARNPAAWPSTLERLATDRRHEVRRAAARHPATPRRSLERLALDPIAAVRCALLANPALPPVLRSSLALDDSALVRRRALRPPR